MTSTVPAGWYSDPARRHQFRYWDGVQWTAHVSTGGFTSVDPAGPGPAGPGTIPPGGGAPGMPGTAPVPGGPSYPAAPIRPGSPATPGAPAGERKRRRWPVAALAAVVALGVLAGVLIWAPWVPPPVLRPAGLTPGAATTSSVTFRWSGPATGPLPDRYLILHDGRVVGSVRGTVTTYQVSGLAPASDYVYRVAAERGGKRGPQSPRLLLTTLTPPVSAARLPGSWTVLLKIRQGAGTLSGHPPKVWTEGWTTTPGCPSGPCTVTLSGTLNGHPFRATLKRSGAHYQGTAMADVIPCGSGSVTIPTRSTMIFHIKVTDAGVTGGAWLASSWSGSLAVESPYVSSGSYYCNASTVVFGLSATP